uniref:Zinc finger and BTB domain containing 40 n=1 Tax=Chrysolophus pictus TaxID=9089 RepID=A0A8C3PUF9_CHRPC
MELPSYSKQLLQQLYTLCKEQQFCDCTIFVGTVHFRAHKVVLAAASLLFKSLLDSTDTISIDASVVTPEEFALLLEMMYTGKLPTGKHNFTKVIFVSDSLQMFDVAVSCKTLLRDLISCSTQDQVEVSAHTAESSGSSAEADNLSQSEKPAAEGKTDALHPSGPGEAEMETDISLPEQELTVNHTWLHQDVMLSSSGSLREDSGSCAAQPACTECGCSESKSCKLDFFLQYESVFSEALSDAQAVLRRLEECREIDASQREVVLNCCEGKSQREAMDNLLKKVEEEKTLKAESLVKLLRAVKASFPGLHLLLDNLEVKANISDAKWSLEDYGAQLLRRYQERLVEHLTDTQTLLRGISAAQSLAPADREAMEQIVKCETGSGGFISLVSAALEEQSLSVSVVWQLLLAVREAELPLNMLMEEIQKEPGAELFFQAGNGLSLLCTFPTAGRMYFLTPSSPLLPGVWYLGLVTSQAGAAFYTGLLTEGSGGKPGIRKWKVNSESQVEALDKEEDKAGGAAFKEQKEPQEKASSKKDFICKACEKSFHFYCRLKVHMKRCRVARGKQIQCKECTEVKSTKKELEKHQLEVHGEVGMSKKKKKRLPVTCDICGREFAHASGMQYHKLTEHFDEKPFSCEKCGAKFAANSTLKNHLRLHTGDRPFVCKHCLMTFMQASALAYHTKKKHSEGKMYACQYCDAVFAQSIELSRHVRTHTGDKPYVCRECGKGFRQANGLSIHLRSFHNIEDPYDCRKCRMSFATLQEHRKHIHEVHSREYHPCPDCSKVFSAPSLLERHMVTHVGGKPFSCGTCNKAYQQLSGLWYHNRTHHPDVFAAQNHRSSKFSSLQCNSCDKTFSSTAAHRRHVKAEHSDVKFHDCEMCKEQFPTLALLQVHVKYRHSGSEPFHCLYCSASFCFPGALQHHVTTEHFKQAESTFTCGLCGELFTSQGELEGHCSAEHPKVIFTEAQATTAQVVQVIQTSEQGAAEHIISFDEAQLTGSQVFVTLPESQASQAGSELVTVSMEDLFDDKVILICEETK